MRQLFEPLRILILLLLVGCTVSNRELQDATILCANNDGVSHIYIAGGLREAWCNNGAMFYLERE